MSRSPFASHRSILASNLAAPLGAGILVMVGTFALVGTSGDTSTLAKPRSHRCGH